MSDPNVSDSNVTGPGEDRPVEGTPLDGDALPGAPIPGPGGVPGGSGQPGGQVTQGGPGVDGRPSDAQRPEQRANKLQELVDEPAKVMRIGTMIRQLLEEVKAAPLDDAARGRLAEIHERSIKELEDGLAPELIQELERISLPFPEDAPPSDAELRIAQAQLVGWLEGLFHGIQAAIAAQHAAREQAAAQLQLRQLPPGTVIAPGVVIGENGEPQRAAAPQHGRQQGRPVDPDHGPGQYL
ncbi:bacterial proteasome activator family protein [Pseudarthrobacter sp. J75]|uniref:bacterial proteasome activator family protein n=1 Tax=unclassified Pseudarthrobacter TaxID=2647000 RepID=UPI002E810CCD|nr:MULTISPECIES: bacterial proteasome activator family protein [unclassified Pseudarthrobacter]MEE2522469.1 bacterial proteasome activator family protein [Pseudarthrobacter sp. J47]MEE2529200.1 bacterial proteasome activator family protein [Pseudarthrobacter sp. J75]